MDDLIATLKQISADANAAGTSLRSAVYIEKQLREAIKYAKEKLRIASIEASDAAYQNSIIKVRDAAQTIYNKNVREAATESMEYDYDAFLRPLQMVGEDEDLYKITSTGIGWGRSISVNLAMDEIAGTIDDYAAGVEAVRDVLKVKEDRDPDTASTIWRTKIYGKGPYNKTIKMRLSASGSLAPFWSLLNYGSKYITMSSDIGGTPYPSRGAHRFVEKTEQEIKDYFLLNFQMARYKYERDKEMVESAVIDAEYDLKSLQADVDELSANSEAMDRIARELNVDVSELYADKIIEIANRIKRGEILQDRYTIGRGVRRRAGTIGRVLSDFGE